MEIVADTYIKGMVIDQDIIIKSPYEDIRDTIMKRVVDTSDQQIHDALVNLGWTPPEIKEKP